MSEQKPKRRRGVAPRPVAERFWEKVDRRGADQCWVWTAGTFDTGYGSLNGAPGQGSVYAHHFAYELANGPIPSGLQIDHLCRNKLCVNPAHLEAVTQRENLRRGEGFTGQNARKTHCAHGHEFTPENTHICTNGTRSCRACNAVRQRKAYRRAHGLDLEAGPLGNADKTHCPRGHEYNLENTYVRASGYRVCRVCHRERAR